MTINPPALWLLTTFKRLTETKTVISTKVFLLNGSVLVKGVCLEWGVVVGNKPA